MPHQVLAHLSSGERRGREGEEGPSVNHWGQAQLGGLA